MADLITEIEPGLLAQVHKVRERLHRKAEIGFEVHDTAAFLNEQLEQLSLDELKIGVGGAGLVGFLAGPKPGPVVALRAEMDGLPIHEQTGLSFASDHQGHMHACGHDGHMAIVLGLARLFCDQRERLQGGVKFIFQPNEEEGAGARHVVKGGALEDPRVDAIFAVHARPQLRPGQIELDEVPSAYADGFDVNIRALGCHGAYPHLGKDAVLIASQVIANLQQIVSRQVSPAEEAVVTVGAVQAGRARNVLADRALLLGTMRTRQPEVRDRVMEAVERVSVRTAEALGGSASVTMHVGYPRVRNDLRLLDLVRRVGIRLFGEGNVLDATEATMGADDFSYYLSEQGGVPGCITRLGVETNESLHSDRFDFGHEAVEPGMLLLANVCLAFLNGEADG